MNIVDKLVTVANELGDKNASGYVDFNDEGSLEGVVEINGILVDVNNNEEKPFSIYDNESNLVYETKQAKRIARKCVEDNGTLKKQQ